MREREGEREWEREWERGRGGEGERKSSMDTPQHEGVHFSTKGLALAHKPLPET